MSEIKAIETYYKGYRFRSRLEARWAVFFDAAGIKYEYEPEGFETNEGTKYLPDFYLPEYDAYVEIKPPRDGIEKEIKKAVSCIDNNPGSIRVLLFLSNIPVDDDVNIFWFPVAFKHPLSNDIESVRFAFVPSFDNDGLHPGLNYYIGHRCKEFVSRADLTGIYQTNLRSVLFLQYGTKICRMTKMNKATCLPFLIFLEKKSAEMN